jgi:hypothetical protein
MLICRSRAKERVSFPHAPTITFTSIANSGLQLADKIYQINNGFKKRKEVHSYVPLLLAVLAAQLQA